MPDFLRSYYNNFDQCSQIEELRAQISELSNKIQALSKGPQIVLSENPLPVLNSAPCFLNSSAEVFEHCKEMGSYTREVFRVLFLTTKNRMIADEIINIGTHSSCSVEIKEIFRLATKYGASKIVAVHNHPSGDPAPSVEDFQMSAKIKKAAAVFNITVSDNMIISGQTFARVEV